MKRVVVDLDEPMWRGKYLEMCLFLISFSIMVKKGDFTLLWHKQNHGLISQFILLIISIIATTRKMIE